ncbi:putative alpha-(1,3)-fucosyltransferase 6-like [Apostichopus japonicus]|uniref:Fucosyltransferase n=1 Tax=Stichopus japonicus TaxID=307972 RepID=A0A2G8L319_STIJA|nr:putative alpha-(1,3)-fucosyltransferase 6-like [Apostichopus japonicus]
MVIKAVKILFNILVMVVMVFIMTVILNWRFRRQIFELHRERKQPVERNAFSKLTHINITTLEEEQTFWNRSSFQNKVDPQSVINDTLSAAIFSCNSYWVTGRNQFPRTFECPHTDKRISFTASIEDESAIKDVDVVIFAADVNSTVWEKAMAVRTPHQVWVYSTSESAKHSPHVREILKEGKGGTRFLGFNGYKFNMSFSYHSKSEVVAPFGEYIPSTHKKLTTNMANINAKRRAKKMVAWVSSHCYPAWNRTTFVHDLAKLVPVDTYGACGTNAHLPRNKNTVLLLQKYKFYIAFENNCCSDYITEKFWKALAMLKLVPIVVGASKEDYQRVAPPHSFIYADDFDSVRELARYIRKVATNKTLYNQYHHWRQMSKAVLYTSSRVNPFSSTEGACALLNFLEENAWKGHQSLRMRIDPFGPDWLGSCGLCGKHEWMTTYERNTVTETFEPM